MFRHTVRLVGMMRLFLAFSLVLICCTHCNYGREVRCDKKGFVCYDESRFYQCVHKNEKYIIGGVLKECPDGLVCKNDAELECEEEIPREYIVASNIETFDEHRLDEI